MVQFDDGGDFSDFENLNAECLRECCKSLMKSCTSL